MVASPVIGNFCACRYTSYTPSVMIFQLLAAAIVTVLNCFMSTVCCSRAVLSSAAVVHAEVFTTSPGYVGSTK